MDDIIKVKRKPGSLLVHNERGALNIISSMMGAVTVILIIKLSNIIVCEYGLVRRL